MICYNTLCPFCKSGQDCKDYKICNSFVQNPKRPTMKIKEIENKLKWNTDNGNSNRTWN